jgi:hypothetical protein
MKKQNVFISICLILCIALAISSTGCGKNPNVQIVTLESAGVNISANGMKYLGYVTVKTEKGEEMDVDWPEKSFFDMTGGKVKGGMKLQIEKNKDTNKWEVTRIVGESNSK